MTSSLGRGGRAGAGLAATAEARTEAALPVAAGEAVGATDAAGADGAAASVWLAGGTVEAPAGLFAAGPPQPTSSAAARTHRAGQVLEREPKRAIGNLPTSLASSVPEVASDNSDTEGREFGMLFLAVESDFRVELSESGTPNRGAYAGMRISSKGHYGLLAVAELARHYDDGLVSLAEIAQAEHLPLPYLEQIIAPLRMAGIVEATRGLHGGYRLARDPSQVSVGDVVRWLEGPIALVECTTEGYVSGSCERETGCTSRGVWKQVSDAINDVLNTLSLADLIANEAAQAERDRRFVTISASAQAVPAL